MQKRSRFMAHDGVEMPKTALFPDLLDLTAATLPEIEALLERARAAVRARTSRDGKPSAALLEEHQFAAHGLSWLATYVEALRQLRAWAGRVSETGAFGEMEALILPRLVAGLAVKRYPTSLGLSEKINKAARIYGKVAQSFVQRS